jgi:hypothetical protein
MGAEWRFAPSEYGTLGWIETACQVAGNLAVWVGFFYTLGALGDFLDGNEKARLGSMIMACVLGLIYLGAIVERVFLLKETLSLAIAIFNFLTALFLAIALAYTGFPAVVPLLAASLWILAQITKLITLCTNSWRPEVGGDKREFVPSLSSLSSLTPLCTLTAAVLYVLTGFHLLCIVVLWILEIVTAAQYSSTDGWIGARGSR